jgi:hypothetical protein
MTLPQHIWGPKYGVGYSQKSIELLGRSFEAGQSKSRHHRRWDWKLRMKRMRHGTVEVLRRDERMGEGRRNSIEPLISWVRVEKRAKMQGGQFRLRSCRQCKIAAEMVIIVKCLIFIKAGKEEGKIGRLRRKDTSIHSLLMKTQHLLNTCMRLLPFQESAATLLHSHTAPEAGNAETNIQG